MKQTRSSTWDGPSCSAAKPCNECSVCEEENNKQPAIDLDGEITLYESSLGWLPFKE